METLSPRKPKRQILLNCVCLYAIATTIDCLSTWKSVLSYIVVQSWAGKSFVAQFGTDLPNHRTHYVWTFLPTRQICCIRKCKCWNPGNMKIIVQWGSAMILRHRGWLKTMQLSYQNRFSFRKKYTFGRFAGKSCKHNQIPFWLKQLAVKT